MVRLLVLIISLGLILSISAINSHAEEQEEKKADDECISCVEEKEDDDGNGNGQGTNGDCNSCHLQRLDTLPEEWKKYHPQLLFGKKALTAIEDTKAIIVSLDPTAFKKPKKQEKFIEKLDSVIEKINKHDYEEALEKLKENILEKTNGCATSGEPDENDWIIDCESQGIVYPSVLNAISIVEQME